MLEDPNPFVVWNAMGLVLVSTLLIFIVLIVQRSQKRIQTEALERHQHAVRALEEERLRIAANIHDDLVSQIHRLRLSYHKAEGKEKLDEQLLHLLSSARTVSHQLSPPMPDTIQLQELIDDYLSSLNGTLSFVFRPDIRTEHHLNSEIKLHLFRIVQELITNVYKHAQAKKMELLLKINSDYVYLVARDDGIGFHPSVKTGLGMQNIQLRSQLLKAHYKFKSQAGTTFILVVPLQFQQQK